MKIYVIEQIGWFCNGITILQKKGQMRNAPVLHDTYND
jgi:hypothetical protein